MPHPEAKTAGLDLDTLSNAADLTAHSQVWEHVVRKLVARQMPPPKEQEPRPKDAAYDSVIASLEGILDDEAAEHPNPGRTETLRRLNRTEYQNAIRDLLAAGD